MQVGGKSPIFAGSLCREGSYREACVGRSKIISVLVARLGERAVIGRRVLVGEKSQWLVGGSLWREGGYREACVGGSRLTVVWWFALAKKVAIGNAGGSKIAALWSLAMGEITANGSLVCWWEQPTEVW